MKKRYSKHIGTILLLVSIVGISSNLYKTQRVRKYIYNKDLEIIKENWQGNVVFGSEFTNTTTKDKPAMPLDILKWKLINKNPQAKDKKQDDFSLKVIKNTSFINSDEDMIVWLGHASFFIRINGKTILTDPVLGDVSFIKRLAGNTCKTESLKNIDYLLLSHGHRDHFDKNTLKIIIKNNPNITALVPLELHHYFDKNNIQNQQAGWYQKYKIDDIEIYFLPAKHWNRRGVLDFNKNLWGSFVIKHKDKTIYFAGDTAYGNHFKEIHTLFGSLDYCLLPIGAYKPEFIMRDSHMNPTEALQAFQDLQGKVFIPMHYATYDLSDEPIGEPYRIIQEKISNYNIKTLAIGEELTL